MLDRSEPNLFDPTGASSLHPFEEREPTSPAPEPVEPEADFSSRSRRLGRRGRARRVARYVPTAVILLAILTHPIGCAGQVKPPVAVPQTVTQTVPPTPPKAVGARPRAVAPEHRPLRVVRRHRTSARAAIAPLSAPAREVSAPVAVAVRPVTSPSVPSSPPGQVAPVGTPGVEFGFER
jgi:hypothetical protein